MPKILSKTKPRVTAMANEVFTRNCFRQMHPSVWNFWKDGVTSSFLSSFLTCREQTRLSYVEGWISRHTPFAFEFGTCNHWIFEQAYSNTNFISNLLQKEEPAALEEHCKKMVKAYQDKWLGETPDPTPHQLESQEMVYGLAECVLPPYFRRWDGDFTGQCYSTETSSTRPHEWVNLEEVFNIPYIFPDGAEIPLRGRRDGVFRDKKDNLWVFDTKCRSVINHEDAIDTLPSDLQQMMYLYITMLQYGEIPAGVVMNIVRRPGHRRGKYETLKEFLDRVRKEVAMPKTYDHYYVRYQLVVDRNDIMEWKKEVFDPLLADVRAWWEGTAPHYMNPNSLISKYGRCALFLPIVKKEFGQCFKRTKAFSELA